VTWSLKNEDRLNSSSVFVTSKRVVIWWGVPTELWKTACVGIYIQNTLGRITSWPPTPANHDAVVCWVLAALLHTTPQWRRMTSVLLLLVRGVWVTGTNISPYQWYMLRLCSAAEWPSRERGRQWMWSQQCTGFTPVVCPAAHRWVPHHSLPLSNMLQCLGAVLLTSVVCCVSVMGNAFFFCWKIVYETINLSDMIDSVTALTVWIVTSCSNVLQYYVVGVLPKSTNPKHIEENAQIFDFQLSDDQMSRLTGINCNVHYCWDPSSVLWGAFISVFLCVHLKSKEIFRCLEHLPSLSTVRRISLINCRWIRLIFAKGCCLDTG